MGLFSSSYETTVATSVVRVIDNEMVPDSIRAGSFKAIANNLDIADHAMEELVSSIGIRAEQMYSYGDKKYVHGSPTGEVYSNTQGREEVEEVIQSLHVGKSVEVDYSFLGSPNHLHIGWMRLLPDYAYDIDSNELKTLSETKKTPVYLTNITVHVPSGLLSTYEENTLAQWGIPASANSGVKTNYLTGAAKRLAKHNLVKAVAGLSAPELFVEYEWEDKTVNRFNFNDDVAVSNVLTGNFTVPIELYDYNADFFHVRYFVDGVLKYWIYQLGTGTYPSLDALFDKPQQVNGQFFPFAYFRFGKQRQDTDKTSEKYKSSKKLVKYLGMDYDDIAEAINTNPDIADIEQAMLIMAIPANTTDAAEQEYLFEFFETMYFAGQEEYSSAAQQNIRSMFSYFREEPSSNVMVIRDKLFQMSLGNAGIYKKLKAGNIGKKGTFTSGTYTESRQVEYEDNDNDSGVTIKVRTVTDRFHFYRKQVTAVTYQEVLVKNLKATYYIYRGYNTIGSGTDETLLIPIDRSITKKYNIALREKLYGRSLHYVFNSRVTVKVKWYQQGIFGDLLMIAAIVIAIWTIQPEIYMMAIAVSAGTMTVTAFLWAVATMYVLPFLIATVAVKYFVKVAGAELAFLVAIVALAYGSFQAIQAGSISGAPWAQDLLSLSTNLTTAINDLMTESLMGLVEEAKAFGLELETQTELLDEKSKLLTENNIYSTVYIPGEKASDFYNRTIHSGNVGVLGLDAVSSYVQLALTLPKITDNPFGENDV